MAEGTPEIFTATALAAPPTVMVKAGKVATCVPSQAVICMAFQDPAAVGVPVMVPVLPEN